MRKGAGYVMLEEGEHRRQQVAGYPDGRYPVEGCLLVDRALAEAVFQFFDYRHILSGGRAALPGGAPAALISLIAFISGRETPFGPATQLRGRFSAPTAF